MEIASETFKANAAKALHDGELQRALLNVPAGFINKHSRRGNGCRSSRLCAKRPAISRTMYSGISTSISNATRRWSRRVAASCITRLMPLMRGSSCSTLRNGSAPGRHQRQVDGGRGNRDQRAPEARHHAGRNRSRRVHHPAARRASEPHHRSGRAPDCQQVEADFRRCTPICRADRNLDEPLTCSYRGAARCCATSSLPPMSASPAPIS